MPISFDTGSLLKITNPKTLILSVKRYEYGKDYTIGKIFVNGEFFGYTLEDEARPRGIKVKHHTCIPEGVYDVEMTMSNRFKKRLPLLKYVPGFSGIRIHTLNTEAQTSGCLGVGYHRTDNGKIFRSADAVGDLIRIIEEAEQTIILID